MNRGALGDLDPLTPLKGVSPLGDLVVSPVSCGISCVLWYLLDLWSMNCSSADFLEEFWASCLRLFSELPCEPQSDLWQQVETFGLGWYEEDFQSN